MTLKSGLFSNVFWRSLQIFSTLVLNILIARYLGAAGSGTFFYLITIFTLYVQVGALSLESAIGFFTSNKQIPVTSLAAGAILWSILVTVLAMVVFALLHHSQPVNWYVLLNIGMFMAGNLLTNYFSSIFFAMMNFRVPNIFSTLINLLLTVFLAVLLFTNSSFDKPLFIRVFFFCFLLRGLFVVASFYGKPENRSLPRFITKSQAWLLLRYSALAYASNLVFFILYRIDYYFVEKYCSAVELGNYIQVCRIAQMFFLFPSMIATVVFPLTSSENGSYIRQQLPAITRVLFYGFIFLCGLLCFTGYWIFPFVFGQDFSSMYGAFLWLVPGIIALSVLYPFSAYYSGINQVSMNIKGSLLALILIVAGDIFLIPRFGIRGAAAVSSIGYITYQVFVMTHFTKTYRVSTKDFFYFNPGDFKRIGRSIRTSTI